VFLEEPDTNMSAFNYKLVKTLTSWNPISICNIISNMIWFFIYLAS
jgi:hypothetical protein